MRVWRGEHAASVDVGRLWLEVGRLTRPMLKVYRYPHGGGVRVGRWYFDAGWLPR